jgi:E3 ubiquitin-protein ligase RNF5
MAAITTLPEVVGPPPSGPISGPLDDNDLAFTCNICLEGVKDRDPVVTQCGHLYCWPCLYRWLHTRHSDGTCPVCKAGVTQDNVIPIFIRGSENDPRPMNPTSSAINPEGSSNNPTSSSSSSAIPNRPQGHRPLPPSLLDLPQNQLGNNPNIANSTSQLQGINFGFFPSLFGLQFQSFAPMPVRGGTVAENVIDLEEEEQKTYLSRVLLFLGVSVILCLLFF